MGILGTEGEGVRATRKAILKYLSETGLIGRISNNVNTVVSFHMVIG